MADLVRSTRDYYKFDTQGDATTAAAHRKKDGGANGTARAYTHHGSTYSEEKAHSEDSKGLSSWTPNGSSNNLNDGKDIDDDNKVDRMLVVGGQRLQLGVRQIAGAALFGAERARGSGRGRF